MKKSIKFMACLFTFAFTIAGANVIPTTSSTNQSAATAAVPNYKVLTDAQIPKDLVVPAHKILVFDFFSYGCPHCYHLSPTLESWLAQNAANIVPEKSKKTDASTDAKKKKTPPPYIIFQGVPVAFEQGWDYYSKAYHIAKMLGQETALHDIIFSTAQNPLLGINSDAQLRSFFLNNAISKADYDRAMADPKLAAALDEDKKLMKDFAIAEIPTVIVADGKHVYYISNTTVQNADPKAFINTLALLTAHRP